MFIATPARVGHANVSPVTTGLGVVPENRGHTLILAYSIGMDDDIYTRI